MSIVVFEDEAVDRLRPITTGRPAYAITCGGYRLVDWIRELGQPAHAHVRRHLAAVQQRDFPELVAAAPTDREAKLLVNARVVPSVDALRILQRLVRAAESGAIWHGDALAAARLPAPAAERSAAADPAAGWFDRAPLESLPRFDDPLPLFEYPHDVVRYHLSITADSLRYRLDRGRYQEIADGVFAADGASLGPYVTTNTADGPILLEAGAVVGAYSFLSGPALLGPRCLVKEHSAVKDRVVLGHTTKIGGEIEASVVEAYTNKQHYGFLGHSYLGSWINLGAGTCNSDLKNTYGEINLEYGGQRVATGMQFFGCVMGDYVKTAINTGVFTGKSIGVCSMVYGFVTSNVPSFVNYARVFGQVTELPAAVMEATQRRMFARRRVDQQPCDVQLIRDMFELTRGERQIEDTPLAL